VTLFDAQIMTHSVTTPDRDKIKYCDFNFVFGLLAFTLYLMPPISIVTDCHNLVPKKNKEKPLLK